MYKYYILTINRNGKLTTIVDYLNLTNFLLVDLQLGHNTFIINSEVISEDDYKKYHLITRSKK